MKLLRYGQTGKEPPGTLDAAGRIRDLSNIIGDVVGASLFRDFLERLGQFDLSALPVVEGSPKLGIGPTQRSRMIAVRPDREDLIREASRLDGRDFL
jgi:hypothetical protein